MTPSASRGDLLSLCQAPLGPDSVHVSSPSKAMQIGSLIHDLMQHDDAPHELFDLLDLSIAETEDCYQRAKQAREWQSQQGRIVLQEKTLWVEQHTLRVKEANLSEEALVGMPGAVVRVTPDLCTEPAPGVLQVSDYKTGRDVGIRARDSIQLGLQGWAAWRWLLSQGKGYDTVLIGYAYIDEVGDVTYRPHKTNPAELQALARRFMDTLASEDFTPKPGMHCRELYCPCIDTCPAIDEKTGQVIPLSRLTGRQVSSEGISRAEAFCIDSPQKLYDALEVSNFAGKRLDELKSAIKEYAASFGAGVGVELPGGEKVYRPVPTRRRNFDKAKAFETYPDLASEEYNRVTETVAWRITNRKK